MLDTIASSYGVYFPMSRDVMAKTDKPLTVETDKVTVTICPGYVSMEEYFEQAKKAFNEGSYDAMLSVLPPEGMVSVIGGTPFGVVDSYDDYLEKYTLSVSAPMNAYNFEDLSKVIKIYNKDASVNELIALAEACSYKAVLARRGQ